MIERIKICWYVLTKKHYAFYAFDKSKINNSGAKCFIKSKDATLFLISIIEFNKQLLNKLNKENKL